MELLAEGVLEISFQLRAEFEAGRSKMIRFRNVPVSLAAACLVRMTELEPRSVVLTLDGDFLIVLAPRWLNAEARH